MVFSWGLSKQVWRTNRSTSKSTNNRASCARENRWSRGHGNCLCSLWFQLSDCFQGVVFDGLETLFARNGAAALLCLLKAIGNRDHIYVLNIAQDYTAMKAQEKAKKEQEGKAPYPPGLSCTGPTRSSL